MWVGNVLIELGLAAFGLRLDAEQVECLDQKLAQVAGDGGVARWDAPGEESLQELSRGVVDRLCGTKVGRWSENLGNQRLGILNGSLGAEPGVMGAEGRMVGLPRETAAAARGVTVIAGEECQLEESCEYTSMIGFCGRRRKCTESNSAMDSAFEPEYRPPPPGMRKRMNRKGLREIECVSG